MKELLPIEENDQYYIFTTRVFSYQMTSNGKSYYLRYHLNKENKSLQIEALNKDQIELDTFPINDLHMLRYAVNNRKGLPNLWSEHCSNCQCFQEDIAIFFHHFQAAEKTREMHYCFLYNESIYFFQQLEEKIFVDKFPREEGKISLQSIKERIRNIPHPFPYYFKGDINISLNAFSTENLVNGINLLAIFG